jgi:hypothetical protein
VIDNHGVKHRWTISKRVRALAAKKGILIPFTDTFGMTVEDVLSSACAVGAISAQAQRQSLMCFTQKELLADSATLIDLLRRHHRRTMSKRQVSIAQSIGSPTMDILYQVFCSKRKR